MGRFAIRSDKIRIVDRETGTVTGVDQGLWMFQGALNSFSVSWSPDSRWLAYSRGLENRHEAVFLFDTQAGRRHQVTAGFYNDARPVFGPDGKYLFFQSDRTFQPVYSNIDNSWVYPNTTSLVAVPLRRDVPSPLAPRNDDEELDEGPDAPSGDGGAQGTDEAEADEAEPVEIDLDGFESRLVPLPPDAGNYTGLHAVDGKLVYRRLPRTGSGDDESPLVYYDLEEREEKTVLGDVDGFVVSADGTKVLVAGDDRFAIIDLKPDQKLEQPLRDSLGFELLDRRADRGAGRVAHLPERWGHRDARAPGRGPARGRLVARERRVPHRADHRWRTLGLGGALATPSARGGRERGRLRSGGERDTAGSGPGSMGRLPGPGRPDGVPDGQRYSSRRSAARRVSGIWPGSTPTVVVSWKPAPVESDTSTCQTPVSRGRRSWCVSSRVRRTCLHW